MRKVYIISGLGADEQAFQFLEFENVEPVYINWIAPASQGESMSSYARRLLPQITELYPVIIGMSFGGMMAIELSRYIAVEKIILISSVKGREELPKIFAPLGSIGIFKMLPFSFISKFRHINHFLFGAKTAIQKEILDATLAQTDSHFYKWAMRRVVRLKKTPKRINLVHIHGTKDLILPFKFVRPDYVIESGGHLMIIDHAKEISEILKKEIPK